MAIYCIKTNFFGQKMFFDDGIIDCIIIYLVITKP